MVRQIIHIDEEKCNGCGLCANACHEGAIDIVNGKAKLVRENFCDGFGDCLPGCPTGAITFEVREAPAYDEEAVKTAKTDQVNDLDQSSRNACSDNIDTHDMNHSQGHGCPGSRFKMLSQAPDAGNYGMGTQQSFPMTNSKPISRLMQWPCQIKLLPPVGDFYNGARLLIAADCTAYAYANMHEDFMKGRVTLIGCPKLDDIDYTDKLREIIKNNDIKDVTIVRMEVPCCGGLQRAAENALRESGKFIPWQVVTISRDGNIINE